MKTRTYNRILNIVNFLMTILVSGTGLVLFIQFHIGGSPYQKEWIGLGKNVWQIIHQVSATGFFIGFAVHIQNHWKYIRKVAKRWQINLPQKTKSRTRKQILLFIITLVVLWAGFYPWLTMPGMTIEDNLFHGYIDVHNKVGIIFLISIIVHITRRRRRMFRPAKRDKSGIKKKLRNRRTEIIIP